MFQQLFSNVLVAGGTLLGVLVFVHEFGHFIVAKMMGVRVLTFSIGFGPRLFGVKIGDTDYRISAFPLGGYVRMYGDESMEGEVPKEDEGVAYLYKSVPAKIAIAVAGPLANFIFPVGLLFVTFMGPTPFAEPVVGEILSGTAAEKSRLEFEDRIVSIDDKTVKSYQEMNAIVAPNAGKELVVKIERKGKTKTLKIKPDVVSSTNVVTGDSQRGRFGIYHGQVKAKIVVDKGSIAEKAGLQDGDEVRVVHDFGIVHAGDLERAFGLTKDGAMYTVMRDVLKKDVAAAAKAPEKTATETSKEDAAAAEKNKKHAAAPKKDAVPEKKVFKKDDYEQKEFKVYVEPAPKVAAIAADSNDDDASKNEKFEHLKKYAEKEFNGKLKIESPGSLEVGSGTIKEYNVSQEENEKLNESNQKHFDDGSSENLFAIHLEKHAVSQEELAQESVARNIKFAKQMLLAEEITGRQNFGIHLLRGQVRVVKKGTVAAQLGIKEGDQIIGVDGVLLVVGIELSSELSARPDDIHVVALRKKGGVQSQVLVFRMEPRPEHGMEDFKEFGLGVSSPTRNGPMGTRDVGAGEAFQLAVTETKDTMVLMVKSLVKMFTGQLSIKSVGGPIMIFDLAQRSAERGLSDFLHLMVLISVSLGVFNLLPMPILDGGHILLFIIEAVRGKKASLQMQERLMKFGLLFLFSFMIFAVINDLIRSFS
ncbi:MAG: RIP metalloprotease RseP [Deltaproteobacteria bacterium]|nr:RIP metalloprotease RseP [Deltaproteobacteria bacterium]